MTEILVYLGEWFAVSLLASFCAVRVIRTKAPRDLDKELAPADADLLDLSGRRW